MAALTTHGMTTAQKKNQDKAFSQQLLFLRHATECTGEGCTVPQCSSVKKLLAHITDCENDTSSCNTDCCISRQLIEHFRSCQKEQCVVCGPTRDAIQRYNTFQYSSGCAETNRVSSAKIRGSSSKEEVQKEHIRSMMAQRLLEIWKVNQVSQGCSVLSQTHTPSDEMKLLLRHIKGCKHSKCTTRHCVSTKFVLSHHVQCVDETCTICGPVRAAVNERDATMMTAHYLTQEKEPMTSSTLRMFCDLAVQQESVGADSVVEGRTSGVTSPRSTQKKNLPKVPLFCSSGD